MLRMHAEMMIRDHSNMSTQLKSAAASAGVGVPTQMLPMHRAMLDELARSPTFDATYRSQQIASHREALVLMDRYARRGNVPQLRGVAAAAVPVSTLAARTAKSSPRADIPGRNARSTSRTSPTDALT